MFDNEKFETDMRNSPDELSSSDIEEYFKGEINLDVILSFLNMSRNILNISDIIEELSYIDKRSNELTELIKSYAMGVDRDFEDELKIASLYYMSRKFIIDSESVYIIAKSLSDSNEFVRVAAFVAFQKYCGIKDEEVRWKFEL
jgi:hypothetical protein